MSKLPPRLLPTLIDKGKQLLLRREGPLTRELLQTPGKFGLGRVPARLTPTATTTMVCGFCSTGCGLNVHLKDGAAVSLTPKTDYPVNLGMACPKGWEALKPLEGPGRADRPRLRRDGKLVEATWEEALFEMVDRFKTIQQEHGPGAIAWLGSGQLPTEELAFLGALGKFGMGMLHGDGNTRQCMATAVVAYKQAFGFDAPPFTYNDFEESDVIVLVGSNLCIAHPIMWERVCKNRHNPKIIVVDPRKTETAMAATAHYAPRPKSDLTLFYGIANWLVQNGYCKDDFIAQHTTGFEAFREQISKFDLERVSNETGLSPEAIEDFARAIAEGKRVSLWWTMGVNQSHQGVRTAQALIAIALMTGNIGRPGTGANSVTGQCNAMGSRLFSNTTGLLGGRDFTKAAHRAEVAEILDIPEANIPSTPSLAYDQIVDAIESGAIRGLWVVGTNPAHSWIHQGRLKEVLGKLDCLVVQDMYEDTETALLADVILPAAGWGEKEGTFINSERRIGVIKRVSVSPGQALADFHIFRLVAEAWGCAHLFERWSSPEAVFQLMKELSRNTPANFSGVEDYAHVDREGGIQWPLAEGQAVTERERRLFTDGHFFTPDAKAVFLFDEPRPMPETTSPEFPILLLTGRGSSSQWHTQTRTKRSDVLRKLAPTEVYVEISPLDAEQLLIRSDSMVRVTSARASIVARAFVTQGVRQGEAFAPMHYEEVNQLTFASFDPYSRQPAYKGCAIRIEAE